MASKTLDLLIKVTDQASGELEKIKGSTAGQGAGVAGLGEALSAAAGYAVLAGMALQKIGNFTAENIDEFTDYVLGVDRLSEAFGLTIEEGEEVVLMADAMGLSNDALFSTLNKLARDGYGVGIKALEGLRKEFQDIEEPADRAQFLFGKAGEQGQKVLAPMLDMTELEWNDLIEGIEALAQVDDEMASNAEDLALAAAGVEQAWTNVKLTLMNWAAPGLTRLLEEINNLLLGGPIPEARNNPGAFGYGGDISSAYGYGDMFDQYNPNARSDAASADRWDLLADRLGEQVGSAVRDAVERVD